jgi:carboxyl-terminal processing protease
MGSGRSHAAPGWSQDGSDLYAGSVGRSATQGSDRAHGRDGFSHHAGHTETRRAPGAAAAWAALNARARVFFSLAFLILLVASSLPLGAALAQEVPRAGVHEAIPAFPREEMQGVFAAGFAAILDRHMERALPSDLITWSLAGFSAHDPSLRVERQGRDLRLIRARRTLMTRALPSDSLRGKPEAIGMVAAEALIPFQEAAWAASPAIRDFGRDSLLRASFDAIFGHLDPFSRYVTPEEAQLARERRLGQGGVGLRLAAQRGQVVVAAVTRDGPAAAAGIRVGDRLVTVDAEMVLANDMAGAELLLEGAAESEVTLVTQRAGRRRSVTLQRVAQRVETVSAATRDGVLHLRVSGFTALTSAQVTGFVEAAFAAANPPRGLVLDLRGNRGGILTQAVAVADIFLDAGEIVGTAGRHAEANRRYSASDTDLAQGQPIVVMVDGRTASAAEILAAALAERGRAAVLGTGTQGKGLVQILLPLPNGGELQLSWSRIVMPSGWPLQGAGLLPALCTAGGDEAAATALAALRAGQQPMGAVLARLRALRPPASALEAAVLRESCPGLDGMERDTDFARALVLDAAAYRAALMR